MAMFRPAVLTEAGLRLNAKIQAGLATISFTKAATGDGEYGENESAAGLTDLKSQKQEFLIDRVDIVNDHTVHLKFVITNNLDEKVLEAGYYVKEVGIFAKDSDEGEILYAVAIAIENQWDYMPTYNGMQSSTIIMEFYTEVSNAESVTIITRNSAYAYQQDLDELQDAVEKIGKMIEELQKEWKDGQGLWTYEAETLIWSAGSGGGAAYDPDTETLIMGGGDAAGIAEKAAAIVESNIREISNEEISRMFQ